ncbi:MAG: AAA family ATPase [Acidobacteriota bacterium]
MALRRRSGQMPRALSHEEMRPRCPARFLPWGSTRRIQTSYGLKGIIGQERAIDALRLGLSLRSQGYNIFVTGLPGTGRTTTTEALVRKLAPRPFPCDDFAYVMNWDDPDRPRLLVFPEGRASQFRGEMDGLIESLRRTLSRVVTRGKLGKSRDAVTSRYHGEEKRLQRRFEERANKEGFVVARRSAGEEGEQIDLHYLVSNRPYPMERLEELRRKGKLGSREIARIKGRYAELSAELESVVRKSRGLEARMARELGDIEDRAADRILAEKFEKLERRWTDPSVHEYLDAARQAVLRDLDLFVRDPAEPPAPGAAPSDPRFAGDPFLPYRVNVILDSRFREWPPVVESHPSYRNLFGSIERVERPGGGLVADFTTIKAGSLLRADGGVIILNAGDVLDEPYVFRTLKRVLRSGWLEIQDPEGAVAFAPTALKPQPIPLDAKVILVGDEYLYDQIWEHEEEFDKLFKVKVEFDETLPFDRKTVRSYAGFVARICEEEGHVPFDRPALARLVDECRRRTGRQNLISARFSEVADLVRESAHIVEQRDGQSMVHERDVAAAAVAQDRRKNLLEEKIHREINEGAVRIATTGSIAGSVNSLVVFDAGGYSFGKPSRVTATVGPGTAGIVNIEREAHLSGRTHDKGVLILAGYLRKTFAEARPLGLTASLALEQSYGGVDGDSASLAECLALLSALSGVAFEQRYGVTGAIDQHGAVMAVGGVTEKIEGFHRVVAERGELQRRRPPGVVMPASNARDLMVSDAVAAAVRARTFEARIVASIDEAIAVVSAVPPAEVHRLARERLDRYHEALESRHRDDGRDAKA